MSTDFCKNNNLLTCLDPNDLAGVHTQCAVTQDPTAISNGLVVADIAGYPLLNGRIGYDSSSPANQIGCYRAASASQSGGSPCHDSKGTPIQGYLACTPDTCASKPYDTNFPLNRCQNGAGTSYYVSIEENFIPEGICNYNSNLQVTACVSLCNPPCANGGTCTMVNDQPICDCSTAKINITDCYGSCRNNPEGRTWALQPTGNACDAPPAGLPDGFVTQMKFHHDGDPYYQCNNSLGLSCLSGNLTTGINNASDCERSEMPPYNCIDYRCNAQGMICGTNNDHATGSDQGLCNCG